MHHYQSNLHNYNNYNNYIVNVDMLDKIRKIDNNKNFDISDRHQYTVYKTVGIFDMHLYIVCMHLDKIDNN